MKSFLAALYAKWVVKSIRKWSKHPIETQKNEFLRLISKAKNTQFGKDHAFETITTYQEFKKKVPIRDYEALKPYIDQVVEGNEDVLWPGKPIYFCKTSGTTSGVKYIPISKESIHNHINSARNALLNYMAETGKSDFVSGKMIFLQGSPVLDNSKSIPTGRLSGIVAHHVPSYLTKNRMPSFKTNCIEDWENKVDAIVEETKDKNMTLISGIPPWVQMYFEKLIDRSGKKTIKEIFPNFNLFVYGGVNFDPYRKVFKRLIGEEIDSIELFPASEGFIAFQNEQQQEGMLLILNEGIFYEFVPAEEIYKDDPTRLSLEEVELDKNYALILNTNAGLWGYNIGDMVRFVSLAPYKVVVSGRVKHFTSAFGEHVIAEEVELAMKLACSKYNVEIVDFHVAPEVNPKSGLPYHEWFIEFSAKPENIDAFGKELDQLMRSKNTYYNDLISGNILKPLVINPVAKNTFVNYMKSIGKLGGQNKLPRLANDRKLADQLI